MTQAELARFLGVHRSTVTRDLQNGVYQAGPDGLIDRDAAVAARAANLDAAKRRLSVTRRSAFPAPSDQPAPVIDVDKESKQPPRDLLQDIPPQVESESVDPREGTLKAAQIQERKAKAGIADLEYARLKGELVELKEIEAAWGSMILTARNRLLLLVEEIDDVTTRAKVMRKLEGILLDLSRGGAVEQQAVA